MNYYHLTEQGLLPEIDLSNYSNDAAFQRALEISLFTLKDKQYKRVLAYIQPYFKKYPDDIHLLALVGIASVGAGYYSKALPLFNQLALKLPGDPLVYLYFAQCQKKRGAASKALEIALEGLENNKNDFLLVSFVVNLLRDNGQIASARAVLEEADENLSLSSHKIYIYKMLATCLFELGDFRGCLDNIGKITTLSDLTAENRKLIGYEFHYILDFFLDNIYLDEVAEIISYLEALLADREYLEVIKERLSKMLPLNKEVKALVEDPTISDSIKELFRAEYLAAIDTEMTQEEREAFVFFSEYPMLKRVGEMMQPIKIIRAKYPGLYEMKADFFDAIVDKDRRRFLLKYFSDNAERYDTIYQKMMEKLDLESEDEDEDEEDDDGYEGGRELEDFLFDDFPVKVGKNINNKADKNNGEVKVKKKDSGSKVIPFDIKRKKN